MKTYIIIEKDVEAEKCIRTTVDQFNDMSFSGTAKDQKEVLNLIFKTAPDIVFFGFDNVVDDLPDFLLDVVKHIKKEPVFLVDYPPLKNRPTRLINMISLIFS